MKFVPLFSCFLFSFVLLFVSAFGESEDFGEEDIETADDVPVEDVAPAIEPVFDKPVYKTPVPTGNFYLAETFDSGSDYKTRWVTSKARKDDADDSIAKYDGEWSIEEAKEHSMEGDLGLVLKSRAKHHAIAVKLDKPFYFVDKPLIVQYQVKFQNGLDCGGAYIKLLSEDSQLDLEQFKDKTQYTIMFGPDKCGTAEKLHFIFQHKNPIDGQYEQGSHGPGNVLENEMSWKSPGNVLEFYLSWKNPGKLNVLENVLEK
jgi:hypothetical protein